MERDPQDGRFEVTHLDPNLFSDDAIPQDTRTLNAGIIELTKDMASWWEVGAAKVREARANGQGVFPAPVKSERARWIEIDGPAGKLPLRVIAPDQPRGVYLHIHGGGHVLGAADQQDRLLEQRIPITAAIYLFMVGTAIAVECVLFPERRGTAMFCYAAHVSVSAFWLGVVAFRPARLRIATAAVGLACSWSVVLTSYTFFVVQNPERLASGHICLLYGLFFLLPWRWENQLAVSLVTLVAAVVVGFASGNTEQTAYGVIVVATGLITSVGGVVYLDR